MTAMDTSKIDKFWSARQAIADPRTATNYRNDGRLELDIALVEKYRPSSGRYLDLGAGTGTLTGHFLETFEETVAVDKWPGFLSQMPAHPRLAVVAEDIASYSAEPNSFDLITLFGVMNFVPAEKEDELLGRWATLLTPTGVFIAKHQCGITDEVLVDKPSEELGAWYHARYPYVQSEVEKMSRWFEVELIDPYPPEINRWPNTHFYAFVCRPRIGRV